MSEERQRPPAEVLYADELHRLAEHDAAAPRPARLAALAGPSWRSSSATTGGDRAEVRRRARVRRALRRRAGDEPRADAHRRAGHRQELLSELLAAAISGDSTLTIQGSAGTTEDHIKYSWNYALLLAEGPSERSLVPAPLYRGMKEGKIVRFEEITRCPLEVQDVAPVGPQRPRDGRPRARRATRGRCSRDGFNVIATANTRDRGVNEMCAALKRRFNFETVQPIADLDDEMALVSARRTGCSSGPSVPVPLPPEVDRAARHDVPRAAHGQTGDGKALEPLRPR